MNTILVLMFATAGLTCFSQNCVVVKTGTFVIEEESCGGSNK